MSSIRKGGRGADAGKLPALLQKLGREVEETRRIDFFSSRAGAALENRLRHLQSELKALAGLGEKKPAPIGSKRTQDYQGRTWVTRKGPFVDRMASAWLIKRFLDKKATFAFRSEKEIAGAAEMVSFDVGGGEFTHTGDLCTFEVLIKAFGLKEKALRKIAEIVHELDIKDDKYRNPEAVGLGEILSGIRKSTKDDMEMLEKGMSVFEMLYLSQG
jgi:hypothetical protein